MANNNRKVSDYFTLRRRSSLPIWADIAWRVTFVLALIGMAVSVHYFDRNGLQDSYDGDVSFLDVVYFTMISITTTGYGDIAPVTERARMTSGSEAVQELLARGTKPEEIVVIDSSDDALSQAEKLGCAVINGDATRDNVLMNVKISRARSLIVSAGRDDTSILIVLTARHLAYHLPISVSIKASDNELLARQAGATTVINPVSFAGLLLAGSCEGAKISDYLSDLASATGRVKLVQRAVTEQEVGMAMSEVVGSGLGVRIYRGDAVFGFWEEEASTLEAGDIIVEIMPGNGTENRAAGKG